MLPVGEVVLSYSETDARCAKQHALVTDRYKYIYAPNNYSQALLQSSSFFDHTCQDECMKFADRGVLRFGERPLRKRNFLAMNPSAEIAEWIERLRFEMTRHMYLPRYWRASVVPSPARQLDCLELEQLRESLRTLGYIE